MRICIIIFFLTAVVCQASFAQVDPVVKEAKETVDTLSSFASFNKKAEALFKILPVPLYSYTLEAGNIYGLAKFNVFDIYKNDTLTKPSKISGVGTTSTKGRVNVSLSAEIVLKQNKYIFLTFFNYKVQPEYFFGIGNDVKRENVEQINYSRFRYSLVGLKLLGKHLYGGLALDIANYYNIKIDSTSYLVGKTGSQGGTDVGLGFSGAYDSRDNRYNSYHGAFILSTLIFYPKGLSTYGWTKFDLDARKFFNPWLNHVIAIQGTTTYTAGDVPFYDLALMGGDNKMRGYYQGAFRDKVLVDTQVEYRMPVWSIFGVTGWLGAGRVAPSYSSLALNGFRWSYGAGLRIKVDSKHNTNLRADYGWGNAGVHAFYISFAEAF